MRQQLQAYGVRIVGQVGGLDSQGYGVGLDPGVVVEVRFAGPVGDGVDRGGGLRAEAIVTAEGT